jgi:type I protein arginine methyltransferase
LYAPTPQDWHRFKRDTRQYYDVDMTVLEGVYEHEQKGYYILSSFWAELGPDQCVGAPALVKAFDMHTCTLEVSLQSKLVVLPSLNFNVNFECQF